MPTVFDHLIGEESDKNWRLVQAGFKRLRSFDVPSRTIIVPHSPFIKSTYCAVIGKAKKFLNPVDVKGRICETLRVNDAHGILLYERALKSPLIYVLDETIAQYGNSQRQYLSIIPKHPLYEACSDLEDGALSSEVAEERMSSNLRSHFRLTEPRKILDKVLNMHTKVLLDLVVESAST